MTDVLGKLSEAAWRGIEFPIAHSGFGFSQDQEAHRFLFRDEQLIESLGLTNPTYRYTIPFREDIARGPWKNLFTDVYPKFLGAVIDRSKGILIDPIHGPVQCKATSLEEIRDPNRRDGIDVEVNFVTAPDEDFSRTELASGLATVQGAKGLQGALDRDIAELDDDTKKKLAELNKDLEGARLNPLDFATGAINQVEVAGNKIAAGFGDVAYRAKKLDDSFRRLADPRVSPIRSNLRAIQMAAIDLAKIPTGGSATSTKPIRTYIVEYNIGALSLAAKLTMTTQDLLKLNPSIARSAQVSQGTAVLYYAGTG